MILICSDDPEDGGVFKRWLEMEKLLLATNSLSHGILTHYHTMSHFDALKI